MATYSPSTIQATGYARNIGYEDRLAQKYGKGTPEFNRIAAVVDNVTISDAGRAMNEAVSDAANPTHDLWGQVSNGALTKAAPVFNYAEAKKLSEAGLKEAMSQLGIPQDTKLSIAFNNDGTISVEGGGDKNAELEALVNENHDLRNILVAASGAASMQRSMAAAEQVDTAVNADPSQFERAYAWLANVTRQINSMGFQFDFSEGSLTGSFISNGQKIGLTENMPTYSV